MPNEFILTDALRNALDKQVEAHKYGHGHALVLAGGHGKGGAARLAARAALRVGAGLVTLLAPKTAISENAAHLNAIMLECLPDAYSLRGMLEDPRITALCLGPGLGIARAEAMVPAALRGERPTVLDADAISAFMPDPERLFALLHKDVVMTPHRGEFARLFPDLETALTAGELTFAEATDQAASRAHCTVLLKGPETAIATTAGDVAVHLSRGERAAPWLATAGSGDVLAGIICGLLARGFAPFDATCTGAWLHVEAARSFGPGLIAEDLPDELPKVLRALLS
ncbi:NAD(P)H-hydrate dehydratase [Thioclava sp. A2]|uniref:NAD(P)H-hydrate dehydratase n=1 Tax=Thioclava sp. FCG-A2 TaxID=3080562 RepID=UPI002955AEC6|nr:NAD(P)H-hydrate dehydratase [Thioclava sp. A2]MDV7270003.1 NAD(P)H-hydrate dehydratase [Thioclava sp. A2]